jgi:hypothetical protein
MTWKYKVMRKTDPFGALEHYGFHEVYYNEDGEVTGYTETPCDPYGETVEELTANLLQMSAALLDPVLNYDAVKECCGEQDIELEAAVAVRPDLIYNKCTMKDTVKDTVNELYRSSYLDHYAKKKILEAIEKDIVNGLWRGSYLDHSAKTKMLEEGK